MEQLNHFHRHQQAGVQLKGGRHAYQHVTASDFQLTLSDLYRDCRGGLKALKR